MLEALAAVGIVRCRQRRRRYLARTWFGTRAIDRGLHVRDTHCVAAPVISPLSTGSIHRLLLIRVDDSKCLKI